MANLNTRFTGDASGIVSASKQAKGAVKDFSKTTEQAMSSLGDAFGVNTGKIEQLTSAAKGLGLKLSGSANEGVAAFGKMLGSINAVSMGIAGLGFGAAIASFKALSAEADAFRKTVAGANLEMQSAAYLDTYRQVLHDFNYDTGKSMAQWQNRFKEMFTQVKGVAGKMFLNSMNSTSGAFLGLADVKGWKTVIDQNKRANALGQQAKQLAGDIYALEMKRSESAREWAKMESEAASLKNVSLDKTKSMEERTQALQQAESLIRQIYTEKYDIESAIADKMDAMNALANSTPDQIKAANEQRFKADGLLGEMEQKLSRILSKEQSLAGAAKNTTSALTKQLDAIIASTTNRSITEATRAIGGPALEKLPGIEGKAVSGTELAITPRLEERSLTDISDQISGMLDDVAVSSSEAIGELIGNLVNGEGAWQNFGQAAASALADMAISVGKTAISTGVATIGIKKALESLNGYVAIAAGAALVALGTAVKTSLSNAAAGNYDAGSSVASSSYSSYSSGRNTEMREISVKVSGTLEASGNKLKAVLKNEEKRQTVTT